MAGCPSTWSWRTCKPSQTPYNLRGCPERVRVTRRHHPLLNQEFEVLFAGGAQLVIRLRDGSTMKVPRAWTDVDGDLQRLHEGTHATHLTLASLRELMGLVETLQRRSP